MALNIDDVRTWCRERQVVARGVRRGADFTIRQDGTGDFNPEVHMPDIFHWEVYLGGNRYPCSPSDMERMVAGKMTLEEFVKVMTPREGRSAE